MVVQARGAVFLTDLGGVCKSGDLAPGQSWDVECGPSVAPFKSVADMHSVAPSQPAADATATVIVEGGSEVSCGCSDLQVDVARQGGSRRFRAGRSVDDDMKCSSKPKVSSSFEMILLVPPAVERWFFWVCVAAAESS